MSDSPALPDAQSRPRLALGAERVDGWLGGGLRRDGLHEFHDDKEGVAATGFTLLLASLAGAPLVWLRGRGAVYDRQRPYGPGLAQLGVPPACVALISLADTAAVLRAGLDAVRAGSAAAVLIELAGPTPLLDLTATRRLALAAEASGTLALLIRHGAPVAPGAAQTRWRVASAPSRRLDADAPGVPAFDLDLLRQRGGRDGLSVRLEWRRDDLRFREIERPFGTAAAAAPVSGAVSALAGGGRRGAARSGAA